MEVLRDSLNILKCVHCDNFLTCSPVFIRHEDGEAVCVNCTTPEEPTTRNKQYEAAAKQLIFPCKYEEYGCVKKLKFSEEIPNNHEVACDYKPHICPIVQSGQCEWLGLWKALLNHCSTEHPDKVLNNPCTLTHDITKPSQNTFLLSAFNVLFLLLTKVCRTSGKIYHSVRFLGDSEKAKHYKYNLDIKRNNINLTKPGDVAPEGCLALQENSSLIISINSLLEFLNEFDGTTFTITLHDTSQPRPTPTKNSVEQVIKQPVQKPVHSSALASASNLPAGNVSQNSECKICEKRCKLFENMVCLNCKKKMLPCENETMGCSYMDLRIKCVKHETYFCKYNTECDYNNCSISYPAGKLFQHYTEEHDVCTIQTGNCINILCTKGGYYTVLISSKFGTIACEYYLSHTRFEFKIFSPIATEHLKMYSCSITIINPRTDDSTPFMPRCNLYGKEDWNISFDRENDALPSWNNKFNILVEIER